MHTLIFIFFKWFLNSYEIWWQWMNILRIHFFIHTHTHTLIDSFMWRKLDNNFILCYQHYNLAKYQKKAIIININNNTHTHILSLVLGFFFLACFAIHCVSQSCFCVCVYAIIVCLLDIELLILVIEFECMTFFSNIFIFSIHQSSSSKLKLVSLFFSYSHFDLHHINQY